MKRQCSNALLMVVFLFFYVIYAVGICTAAPVGNLDTIAKSAVIMDGNGNVLYEKNSHEKLPPASVTKVMTLLLGVEAVEQGRIKLTDPVYTSENAWRQGGSQIWLEPGESMSVKEVLTAIAVVSANDAAFALMEHIFGSEQAAVEAMNQRAVKLGLKDTHFANVNGLPVENHYMSAYDTALIAKEAVRHPLYLELCGIKEYWLRDGKNWLVNTNKLLWWYKGADGLKTGWTQEAQYCFVGTAKRDNLRLIAVVFATPEPRSHLRECMRLFDWGYANYKAESLIQKGSAVKVAQVVGGTEKEIQLVAADELSIVTAKAQKNNIENKIVVDENIVAPVEKGQKYGRIIALKDGKEIGQVDLIAEKSINKATYYDILRNMFVDLFAIN